MDAETSWESQRDWLQGVDSSLKKRVVGKRRGTMVAKATHLLVMSTGRGQRAWMRTSHKALVPNPWMAMSVVREEEERSMF